MVCAQEALAGLGLDRVLLLPVHTPPHKPLPDEPGVEHAVRSLAERDEQHPVEAEPRVRLLRQPQMSEVRRVERSAEDPDTLALAARGATHSRIWPVPSATYL